MSDKKTDIFIGANDEVYTLEKVIAEIKQFLEDDPQGKYSLVIGTDSQEKFDTGNGKKHINLVTAIVVRRHGFGGRYFWQKKNQENIHTLRDKIYAETLVSLDFAKEFVPMLKKTLNKTSPKYDLEIHVDVGERGTTRDMIKEVVGMVTGYGFVAKTKPYSYAASSVADKYT